jgi:hypothetical protein
LVEQKDCALSGPGIADIEMLFADGLELALRAVCAKSF